MITSRRGATRLIGLHIMPNIVGVVRFSYGFHRTSSPRTGLVLDTLLGVESVVNIVSDVIVILLLWKTERPFDQTPYIGASPQGVLAAFHNWLKLRMAGILGIFVVWNTTAMLLCCGANLIGLRYPPKWLSVVSGWAPLIIFAAFVKLYYNTLLYDFYKKYDATQGRAFDVDDPLQVSAKGRKRGRWWPALPWTKRARVRAGKGSATPRAGATGKSEGEEGGTTTTAGTTTSSKTKKKGKKRATATPATPPRPATKERKPQKSDRAGADGAAHEASAVSSRTSSAKPAPGIDTAAGPATEVSSAATLRQALPDITETEVSVATTASEGSMSDATNRAAGAAPQQAISLFFRALSGMTPRMLREYDATDNGRAAASAVVAPLATNHRALDGCTPRELEDNAPAEQGERKGTVSAIPESVQKTDAAETFKGRPKAPQLTGRRKPQ
ncbi:hypothetical protein MTO96_009251 [Rhipicephalus appendiculatus]